MLSFVFVTLLSASHAVTAAYEGRSATCTPDESRTVCLALASWYDTIQMDLLDQSKKFYRWPGVCRGIWEVEVSYFELKSKTLPWDDTSTSTHHVHAGSLYRHGSFVFLKSAKNLWKGKLAMVEVKV